MFFDRKLQHKIKFSTKSKRKSKNSSIQPRTSRPKFYDFSLNLRKISSFLWRKQAATGRTSPRARKRRRAARAGGAGERREQSEQSKNSLYLFNEKTPFFSGNTPFSLRRRFFNGKTLFFSLFSLFSLLSLILFFFSLGFTKIGASTRRRGKL